MTGADVTLAQQVQQLEDDHARAVAAVADLTGRLATERATTTLLRDQLAALRPPILWGASIWPRGRETKTAALTRTEAALGPLQVVRWFYPGAPAWPAETGDRPLVVSFKWAPKDVLAGKRDAAFTAWCKAAPDRITWWSYFHEPEDDITRGVYSAADYRAAWRHLATIARDSGRPLRATLILMEYTLTAAARRNWRDYYPGDDVIDVIAWDCYLRPTPARSATQILAGPRRIAGEIGKPWAVAELGVSATEYPDPAVRAQHVAEFVTDLATVAPYPQFVTYFNSDPDVGQHWAIDDASAAAAVYRGGRGS